MTDRPAELPIWLLKEEAAFLLQVLNEVEGEGYGGMAVFECARRQLQRALDA